MTTKAAATKMSSQMKTLNSDLEYMCDDHIKHFQDRLQHDRSLLIEQTSSILHEMKENNEKVADPADSATQNEELIMLLNKQDEAKSSLVRIERSLNLISSGDFGFCMSCGSEIGLPRLEARPTSTQCIDCANLEEMKSKGINRTIRTN